MIDKNSLESLRVFLEDDFLYPVKKLMTNSKGRTHLNYDRLGIILNDAIKNFAKNNCHDNIDTYRITH